jgi:death-on-curing family protein
MVKITVGDVEYLAFRLAKEFLSFDEPIPDFGTRFPHRLESCILTPFQTYAGKDLYPKMVDKAAILFYLLIKNHPFQNGNKRVATTTLLTFLFLNGKWLAADNQEFFNLTVWVAQSPPRFKDQVVGAIRIFIGDHLTDLRSSG